MIQVIQDSKGSTTGVFIPINEWEKLKKQFKGLDAMGYEAPSKQQLLDEMKEAVAELKLIEQGQKKARSIKALLDEL